MRKALIATGVILLFLIVTSLQSYAEDLIYGCIHKKNGKLRVVDSPTECKNPEIAIYWNKVGLQGEPGLPGEQGPEGPQGPTGQQGSQGEQGLQGDTGATGSQGQQGGTGPDGLHCWDLNRNQECDLAEDKNGDEVCDASDCQGPSGIGAMYVYSADDEFLGMLINNFEGYKVLIFIPTLNKFFEIRVGFHPPPGGGTNHIHLRSNTIFFKTDNCTETAYTHGQFYGHDFVMAYFGYLDEDDRNFIVSPDKEIITFRSRWDTGQCVEIPETAQSETPDALPMTEIHHLPFTYPIAVPLKFEMTEK